MLLCGSVIHSTKLATAVCTTSAKLARWEASSSAKNGNRSCMALTAWVEKRPEYCFNRRSSDSGTLSSSSSVDPGAANCLSVTPKSYASFVDGSAKDTPCSSTWTRIGGLRRRGLYVVDSVLPRCRYRDGRIDLTVAGQCLQHRDDLGFGVGVEESAR